VGWVVYATHRPLYPLERHPVPTYVRLVGPQGRSGWVRKISLPSGFDPWTVQPVVSRYTDWAIPAHKFQEHFPTKFRGEAVSRRPLTGEVPAGSQVSPRGTRTYFSEPLQHADQILGEILGEKMCRLVYLQPTLRLQRRENKDNFLHFCFSQSYTHTCLVSTKQNEQSALT
jgi:hypothetical protein